MSDDNREIISMHVLVKVILSYVVERLNGLFSVFFRYPNPLNSFPVFSHLKPAMLPLW